MEPMSRTERAALCNSALEAGEDAPTLCGDWTVKQLVIHLLVRERDPLGAPGILFPPLQKLTGWSEKRMAGQDFSSLVERVRQGPPIWSPTAVPQVEKQVNTLEYYVHHEDIRRAAAAWQPRELTEREQRILWKAIRTAGKGLVRPAGVPVEIRWTAGVSTGLDQRQGGLDQREGGPRRAVLRRGNDPVVVTGPPSEVTLFMFGRDQTLGLEFDGPEDSIKALQKARLGL